MSLAMDREPSLEQGDKAAARVSWLREGLIFLFVSLLFCGVIFESGLWGGSLLAPVDLAPALFGHYRFVDPTSNGIPANHFIVDQIGYDLPLQWTIYHAYRRGEIPWWDPYSLGGRPLLADAHISGADPVRIACYLGFSRFEFAYNWTRIVHFILGGLGFFVLLRRLGFSFSIAAGLALAAQFSGGNSNFFGHPWIQASFVYYPWLWLAWIEAWATSKRWPRIVSPLLVAAIFYAGNIQSHTYLAIFSFVWMLATGWRSWSNWKKALSIVVPSVFLGALLAAPILFPEAELFLLNHRSVSDDHQAWAPIDGPLSLMNFFPWALGSFRTFGYNNLSYVAYIGSAALVLAAIGAFSRVDRPALCHARKIAIGLVIAYGVIISTPVATLLYHRSSGLAILGLVMLGAIGAEAVLNSTVRWRKCGAALAGLVIAIAIVSHGFAWFAYPKLQGKIAARMQEHAAEGNYGGLDAKLRDFQVKNLPHEITFANPEVLAAWASLAFLAIVLWKPEIRQRRWLVEILLTMNLLPLLFFAHRFIPHTPIADWQRLLAGSDEQREVIAALAPGHLRLQDEASARYQRLFPQNLSHLYSVHVIHGVSALRPLSQSEFLEDSSAVHADYLYTTFPPGDPGTFSRKYPEGHNSRFSWLDALQRNVTVQSESLNTLDLSFPPSDTARLIRADTYYPGWTASTPTGATLEVRRSLYTFSEVTIPDGVTSLRFSYQPTHLKVALAVCSIAAVAILLQAIVGIRRTSRRERIA